jgi:hypothetical protein
VQQHPLLFFQYVNIGPKGFSILPYMHKGDIHLFARQHQGYRYVQENISFGSSDSDTFPIDTSASMLIDAYKEDDNQPVIKRRPVNLIIS